jgi:hypothetical protein
VTNGSQLAGMDIDMIFKRGIAMIWSFDAATNEYRLTLDDCTADVWQETTGRWSGRVHAPNQSSARGNFASRAQAQQWCEETIAQFSTNGVCEEVIGSRS